MYPASERRAVWFKPASHSIAGTTSAGSFHFQFSSSRLVSRLSSPSRLHHPPLLFALLTFTWFVSVVPTTVHQSIVSTGKQSFYRPLYSFKVCIILRTCFSFLSLFGKLVFRSSCRQLHSTCPDTLTLHYFLLPASLFDAFAFDTCKALDPIYYRSGNKLEMCNKIETFKLPFLRPSHPTFVFFSVRFVSFSTVCRSAHAHLFLLVFFFPSSMLFLSSSNAYNDHAPSYFLLHPFSALSYGQFAIGSLISLFGRLRSV